jgi:hypothetical protein
MTTQVYRNRLLLKGAECWYSSDLGDSAPDFARYLCLSEPLPGSSVEEFCSIWIDLTQDEKQILAGMSMSTRQGVRRAGEYQFRYQYWHPGASEALPRFSDFYDKFAATKDLEPLRRKDLAIQAACGALDLSLVSAADDTPLVWHAYHRDAKHARQLHTASLFRTDTDPEFRKMIGRANRYHHWQDMLRFKNSGISLFDMGGWYNGTEDAALLRVNEFKQGFGGQIVKLYNCTRGETIKGRLYLALLRAWRRALHRR